MAKPPTGELSNIDTPETRQAIVDITREIRGLKRQRADINAKVNAGRKSLKALGVDLDAWRASERRLEMDPDERDEFDKSHALCNQALGVPAHAYQAELFEEDSEEDVATRKEGVDEPKRGGDLPEAVDGQSETVQ